MTIDLHAHYCPEELAIELKKRAVPPFISENSLNNRIFHMPHGSLNFPKSGLNENQQGEPYRSSYFKIT